jgi:hypothetical protein
MDTIGKVIQGFTLKSADGIIDNCAGVVDGYLLKN